MSHASARTLALAGGIFLCLLALLLTVATADSALAGAKQGKSGKPSVSFKSTAQEKATESGKVVVNVKSKAKKAFKAKLALSLIQDGKKSTVAKARTVKAKKGGVSAGLKFSKKGIPLVQSCLATKFQVKLSYRAKAGKSGSAKRKSKTVTVIETAKMKRDPAQCDGTNPVGVDVATADRCDPISAPGEQCLFPYPNDFYTRSDPSTPTGLRLDLDPASTPTNVGGNHVDPTEINTSDGFSPGAPIILRVPGMDTPAAFALTGSVPITDMGKTFDADQPIVVIDTATGQRQLIWTELDSNATTPADTDLEIHFGKNLLEGHRYVVAIRGMKDAAGDPIEASKGFRILRDGIPTNIDAIEGRRDHFEDLFGDLGEAGIERDDLYMAWDFTVASTENITSRLLSMRDQAFADLGDTNLTDGTIQGNAPDVSIMSSDEFPTAAGHGVENIREVRGTVKVPCFMTDPDGAGPLGPCAPGAVLNLDSAGVPAQNGFYDARFGCNIPRSAVTETGPGTGIFQVDHTIRTSLYGHGLFNEYDEVFGGNIRRLGTENGVLTCGVDFIGMADEDVGPVAFPALSDMSDFKPLPDRLQQGFLDFLYVGRAMIHPSGFASEPEFKFNGGNTVIDTAKPLFYYGNSQGGIAGGALTAVATDFTRSVLYVPGMNYSTLLPRSVDFDDPDPSELDYASILYPSYPDESSRPLLLTLIQSMWDRAEPNGYANHMTTDPLPGTPAHKVLIEMAYGDHQVANVQTLVEARTIGAPLRMPAVDASRIPDGFDAPFVGLQTLGDLSGSAADGSGMYIWDIGPKRDDPGPGDVLGTDPPPITNTAPPGDAAGVDPHDTVINSSPLIRAQIAAFIDTNGKITNPPDPGCGTHPCYAAGWMGAP